MVLQRMVPELYDSFNTLRKRSVNDLIEKPIVVDASSISSVIGILTESGLYEAFIQLSNKVASISIRDILGTKNISSAKPSLIGKIIPSLSYESTLGYAARIMSYYRLRALPIVQKKEIVGQITAKSIVKMIKEGGISRINAADVMTPNPIKNKRQSFYC